MTRLTWGKPGRRIFEAGVDRGVLYPRPDFGVPWNGLISIDEKESMNETIFYYDGEAQRRKIELGGFAAILQAYTYPEEFEEFDGHTDQSSGQSRGEFGLSYRTGVGNDLHNLSHGYKIHVVYGARVSPSDVDRETTTDEVSPSAFSWELTTEPAPLPGFSPTSHVVIDSSIAHKTAIDAVEDVLYGSSSESARLPSISELIELVESKSILRVIDHGDGTWTATGPDSAIQMLDATTFEITWPSAVYINDTTYKLSSR